MIRPVIFFVLVAPLAFAQPYIFPVRGDLPSTLVLAAIAGLVWVAGDWLAGRLAEIWSRR